jgi:hypothetical protein
VRVHRNELADYVRAVGVEGADGHSLAAVVQLWPLNAQNDAGVYGLAQSDAIAGVLRTVQAIALTSSSSPPTAGQGKAESGIWPRLCIVTRGAQECGGQKTAPSPAQAAVLGLAHVIEAEMPELDCVCIDLDPDMQQVGVQTENEARGIVREALAVGTAR